MEICKQLFDLSKLFEQISDIKIVANSFQIFTKQEIEYRKETHPGFTPEQVLQDTIDTCLIITKRERGTTEEKAKFTLLQRGITAFGTGYLMSGNFRIDEAVVASAKVAHLAAKLLINDLSAIKHYKEEDISQLNIENQDWNFLNRLKRQTDKSSFYYWYNTIELLRHTKLFP